MRRSVERARGLASVQGWFFDQLQPGAHRAVGPVAGTEGLPARQRVDIYADMYLARLIDALGQEYPRLAEALGGARFGRVATAYLERFPSRKPTIQDVGDRLPGFLRRELAAGRLSRFPYAADLAQLESVGNEIYVAAAELDQPLAADALRAISPDAWPGLRFRVISTLRVLRLGFGFPKGKKPVREKTVYRVYRRALDVYEAPMDAAETRALALVTSGKTFGEVCLALGDARKAATALATWVGEGLLLAVIST